LWNNFLRRETSLAPKWHRHFLFVVLSWS
jgi:hypothetical protein